MVILSSAGKIWIWDPTIKWDGANHQVRIKNGFCLLWGIYSEELKTGPQTNHCPQMSLVPRNKNKPLGRTSGNFSIGKPLISKVPSHLPAFIFPHYSLLQVPHESVNQRTTVPALHSPDTISLLTLFPWSIIGFSAFI